MSAIEAVAEAIKRHLNEGPEPRWTTEAIARAAVAALAAQGDITDEQIIDAVPIYTTDEQYLAAVRALLARQAAVHATREAQLIEGFSGSWNARAETAEARIADYKERLDHACEAAAWQQSKREAAEARIAELEAANAQHQVAAERLQVLSVSQARAEAAEARVAELEAIERNLAEQNQALRDSFPTMRSENAALRATVERVRALRDEVRADAKNWMTGDRGRYMIRADALDAALADPKGEGA
jgi:chromosome segregation ATPase